MFFFAVVLVAIAYVKTTFAVTCLSDETGVFIRTKDFSFPSAIATATGQTINTCISSCGQNYIPSTNTALNCSGFNYYDDGACEFFSKIQSTSNQLSPSQGVQSYEKVCVHAQKITCLSGFDRQPQKVFSGFARDVLPDVSKADCLYGCLDAEYLFGYKCLSVMYYYDTKECILNSAKAADFPNLVRSTIEDVDYIDHRCDGEYSTWSQWSECIGNNQSRSRTCSPPGTCLGRSAEQRSCGTTTTTTTTVPTTTVTTTTTTTTISPTTSTTTGTTSTTSLFWTTGMTTPRRCRGHRCRGKSSKSGRRGKGKGRGRKSGQHGEGHGKHGGNNYGYGGRGGRCSQLQGRDYQDCIRSHQRFENSNFSFRVVHSPKH